MFSWILASTFGRHWNASQSIFPVTTCHTRETPLCSKWQSLEPRSMAILLLPCHAQGAWLSNTDRNLRKSKPIWVLGKVALFPLVLSVQCSNLNPLTSRTSQRIKPLQRTWLSTPSVNNSLERSVELKLPSISKCWMRGRVLDMCVEKQYLFNLFRIFISSKNNVEISMKICYPPQ